jgi:hypothetical protein
VEIFVRGVMEYMGLWEFLLLQIVQELEVGEYFGSILRTLFGYLEDGVTVLQMIMWIGQVIDGAIKITVKDILDDLWRYSNGEWTWIGGTNTPYASGIYGTLGVPDPGNWPGARSSATGWIDSSDSLWLLGGDAIVGFGGKI